MTYSWIQQSRASARRFGPIPCKGATHGVVKPKTHGHTLKKPSPTSQHWHAKPSYGIPHWHKEVIHTAKAFYSNKIFAWSLCQAINHSQMLHVFISVDGATHNEKKCHSVTIMLNAPQENIHCYLWENLRLPFRKEFWQQGLEQRLLLKQLLCVEVDNHFLNLEIYTC